MLRKLFAGLLIVSAMASFSACGGHGNVTDSRSVSLVDSSGGFSDSAEKDPATDTPSKPSSESKPQTEDPQAILEKTKHLVGLTDQKNQRIIVCDLAVKDWSKDRAVVWEHKTYGGVAGIKLRDNAYWGGKVVAYCSGYRATIVSYETKQVLFETNNAARNAHSVEVLPSGALVVASSTGNEVRIFAPGNPNPTDAVTLSSAHGALWDPKYNVLWLSGDNVLEAYRITGTADNPKMTFVEGMRYYIRVGLHDLSPVYGNPDALFLTSGSGIVLFDKTTGEVSYDYPGGPFGKTQTYVPGVGNFGQDNVLVFTTVRNDTLVYKEWGVDQVGIFIPLGGEKGRLVYRKAPNDAYYKVRVWNPDYQ